MNCINRTWKVQSNPGVTEQKDQIDTSDAVTIRPNTNTAPAATLTSQIYQIDANAMRPTVSFNSLRTPEPLAGTSDSHVAQHNGVAGDFPRHGGFQASTAASRNRARVRSVTPRVGEQRRSKAPATHLVVAPPGTVALLESTAEKSTPSFFTVSPGTVGIYKSGEILRAEKWDKWWQEQQAIKIDPDTYEKWLKKDQWVKRWRVDTTVQSGATSPKSLRLSEAAGTGVDRCDEEMNNVSRAIEQDRIQKGIWDYLNEQITEMIELCNKAKDWRTNPPASNVRESCGKRFNELFLCGGKHIELQPIAVRGDLWKHFFDQVAPENVATPEAMKVDWAATYRDIEMSEGGML